MDIEDMSQRVLFIIDSTQNIMKRIFFFRK